MFTRIYCVIEEAHQVRWGGDIKKVAWGWITTDYLVYVCLSLFDDSNTIMGCQNKVLILKE